jgi:hypothetical protein
MDSAAVDFSLHQTGFVVDGAFPQQQPLYLTEQYNGSSSHVSIVPLHIMGTSTPAIVALSNTEEVVSLKLTNTNYLYW